jgi:hypothetical protein
MTQEVRVVFENAEAITVGSDTPVPLVYYDGDHRVVVGVALVKSDGLVEAKITTPGGAALLHGLVTGSEFKIRMEVNDAE